MALASILRDKSLTPKDKRIQALELQAENERQDAIAAVLEEKKKKKGTGSGSTLGA